MLTYCRKFNNTRHGYEITFDEHSQVTPVDGREAEEVPTRTYVL
jgi:hypothetical protein